MNNNYIKKVYAEYSGKYFACGINNECGLILKVASIIKTKNLGDIGIIRIYYGAAPKDYNVHSPALVQDDYLEKEGDDLSGLIFNTLEEAKLYLSLGPGKMRILYVSKNEGTLSLSRKISIFKNNNIEYQEM